MDVNMTINITQVMATADRIDRESIEEYNAAVERAQSNYTLKQAEKNGLIALAQDSCKHEYVTTVRWTEDGAFPNEPRSRNDCTICKKENV